ncbi:hypothetical protein D3C81_1243770 [compost metagenome]
MKQLNQAVKSIKQSKGFQNDFQYSFFEILEMDEISFLTKHTDIDTVSNNHSLAEFLIITALRDICAVNVKKELKDDSFCWFFSQENQKHPFSFTVCCHLVGITDPDWFRALTVRNFRKAIDDNEIKGLDVAMYEACRKALLTGDYSVGLVQEPIRQPFI